jgi:hypothetical protein
MRTAALLAIFLAAGLLAGCTEERQCVNHSVAYYEQGLARLLAANGVAHSLERDRGVCFARRDAPKVKAAEQELEKYFYQVADLLRDECEETALVEWATRQGLRFEVHDTVSHDGRPAGRMINLYSFSREEMEANHRKLYSEAPRGRTCDRTS